MTTREGNELVVQKENCVVEVLKDIAEYFEALA